MSGQRQRLIGGRGQNRYMLSSPRQRGTFEFLEVVHIMSWVTLCMGRVHHGTTMDNDVYRFIRTSYME